MKIEILEKASELNDKINSLNFFLNCMDKRENPQLFLEFGDNMYNPTTKITDDIHSPSDICERSQIIVPESIQKNMKNYLSNSIKQEIVKLKDELTKL